MNKLKSYKVFLNKTGRQVMTIIVHKNYDLEYLNECFKHGMDVTVVDQRSEIVNKNYVDKE